MRLGWRSIFGAVVAAFVVACTSPTLPLPPPSPPSESAGTTPGTINLVAGPSSAQPTAFIVVENPATQTYSTVVLADGSWRIDGVAAVKNDVLKIYEFYGNDNTEINFTVLIN